MSFGWSLFATITERAGINGDMYFYYNLSRLQYSLYTGLVSFASLCFIFLLTVYLFKKNASKLTKLFWYFLLFIGLIIICEIYLQARFSGKG
jgi:hypothetical protein